MDRILEEYNPPDVLVNYFPGGHCGYDKEGAPVWITPSGQLDIKGKNMIDLKIMFKCSKY